MATHLNAGDKAPDIKGIDQSGNDFKLSDLKGKRVILFFYPKDNTPGCTKEACDFRDNYEALTQDGFEVVGVSTDTVKSHDKFVSKFDLPYTLLADEDKKIVNDYGVWGIKKMYGREYEGTFRTTFIIDEKGIIEHVIEKVDTKASTAQVRKVLEG